VRAVNEVLKPKTQSEIRVLRALEEELKIMANQVISKQRKQEHHNLIVHTLEEREQRRIEMKEATMQQKEFLRRCTLASTLLPPLLAAARMSIWGRIMAGRREYRLRSFVVHRAARIIQRNLKWKHWAITFKRRIAIKGFFARNMWFAALNFRCRRKIRGVTIVSTFLKECVGRLPITLAFARYKYKIIMLQRLCRTVTESRRCRLDFLRKQWRSVVYYYRDYQNYGLVTHLVTFSQALNKRLEDEDLLPRHTKSLGTLALHPHHHHHHHHDHHHDGRPVSPGPSSLFSRHGSPVRPGTHTNSLVKQSKYPHSSFGSAKGSRPNSPDRASGNPSSQRLKSTESVESWRSLDIVDDNFPPEDVFAPCVFGRTESTQPVAGAMKSVHGVDFFSVPTEPDDATMARLQVVLRHRMQRFSEELHEWRAMRREWEEHKGEYEAEVRIESLNRRSVDHIPTFLAPETVSMKREVDQATKDYKEHKKFHLQDGGETFTWTKWRTRPKGDRKRDPQYRSKGPPRPVYRNLLDEAEELWPLLEQAALPG